ncbi:MAG: hypothetical protein IK095_06305 [Oscillospiraceae bacterium]|nr:hypothetical protein [Oscillospiraceae bacterium]
MRRALLIPEFLVLVGLLVFLIMVGANESLLQILGAWLHELPLFGPWLSALSGFSAGTLDGSINSTAEKALLLLVVCLTSNILDSLLIGVINSFLSRIIDLTALGGRRMELITSLISTVIGVIGLVQLKRLTTVAYAWGTVIVTLLLMFLGFRLMFTGLGGGTRPQQRESAMRFLLDILLAAVETGGMVGLLCSALLLVPMIRTGVPFVAILLWLVCLAALITVVVLVMRATRLIRQASR